MAAERFQTRLAVFVLIRNDSGEILLQQRSNTGFLDGYWDMPSGHIEPNETIVEAAARELEEEVGLTVSHEGLKLVQINQNFLDLAYVSFIFEANGWSGEPKIGEPEKVSAVAFFPPDQLPEKSSLGLRTLQQTGFPDDLTYVKVTPENFETFMREPFDPATWGKK